MISGRSRAVIAAWAFTGIIVLLLNDTRTNAANPGESNVACTAYEWTYNSLHQSPCLVASYTISACSTSAIAVPSGICGYALTPSLLTLAAPCLCSLVVYNLLSACSACQNCSVPSRYPQPIPPGTSVPAWAYLPASNDYWDANSAENDIGAPESTPPSQSTSSTASSTAVSSAVMSTTMSASSTNTSASSMSSASASATTGSDSHSAPRKGAIAGGVVGAVLGTAAVAGIIIFAVVRRRRSQQEPVSPEKPSTDKEQAHFSAAPALPPFARKVYNPDDPSTYPAPASPALGYSSAELPISGERVGYPSLPEL